jgi:hypothetical protein
MLRRKWTDWLPRPDLEYPREWHRRVWRMFKFRNWGIFNETMPEYHAMICTNCGEVHLQDDDECPNYCWMCGAIPTEFGVHHRTGCFRYKKPDSSAEQGSCGMGPTATEKAQDAL